MINREEFLNKVGGIGSEAESHMQMQENFEHGRVMAALRILGLSSRRNAVLAQSKQLEGRPFLLFAGFNELFPTFPVTLVARYLKKLQTGLDAKWSYTFRKFTGTPFYKAYEDVIETLGDSGKPAAMCFARIGFADGMIIHTLAGLPRCGVRLDYARNDEVAPIYLEPFNVFMQSIKATGWKPD